jgi:titin
LFAANTNVISENVGSGIHIESTAGGVPGTTKININSIGTDSTEMLPRPNGTGILIDNVGNTRVGGQGTNLISGNTGSGVVIQGSLATQNQVVDNLIGADANGGNPLGNRTGVWIGAGASQNQIGGTTSSQRNIISGNQVGVTITDTNTSDNVVEGNYIGTDIKGSAPVGNTVDGISIRFGATSNTIGGTQTGSGNVISGNGQNGNVQNDGHGISIRDTGTSSNVIQGNYIGTDSTGTKAIKNWRDGIYIALGADGNTIGAAGAASRNVISANGQWGIEVESQNTSIDWNYVGVDVNGNPLPNGAGWLLDQNNGSKVGNNNKHQ